MVVVDELTGGRRGGWRFDGGRMRWLLDFAFGYESLL
ncbi:hypothetical protein A2U01_0070979 [Trifolium medium]|uniref:Uncharacterized protein n=1 Tax=Trifolium medium TaxID=97028 RepID=A0A392SNZ1_9FABA|nr:hypothetical protein [Trifolium medium]